MSITDDRDKTLAWFVYILRCADNSLYTGITTDINRRVDQHNGINSGMSSGTNKKGAKYTHGRRPVTLVYLEQSPSRSAASKREYVIRTLKKHKKNN